MSHLQIPYYRDSVLSRWTEFSMLLFVEPLIQDRTFGSFYDILWLIGHEPRPIGVLRSFCLVLSGPVSLSLAKQLQNNNRKCIKSMIILISACWLAAMIIMLQIFVYAFMFLAIIWFWNWMNDFCMIYDSEYDYGYVCIYVCMNVCEHDSVLFTWVCGSLLATFF